MAASLLWNGKQQDKVSMSIQICSDVKENGGFLENYYKGGNEVKEKGIGRKLG
jgi:hypothetical protein